MSHERYKQDIQALLRAHNVDSVSSALAIIQRLRRALEEISTPSLTNPAHVIAQKALDYAPLQPVARLDYTELQDKLIDEFRQTDEAKAAVAGIKYKLLLLRPVFVELLNFFNDHLKPRQDVTDAFDSFDKLIKTDTKLGKSTIDRLEQFRTALKDVRASVSIGMPNDSMIAQKLFKIVDTALKPLE